MNYKESTFRTNIFTEIIVANNYLSVISRAQSDQISLQRSWLPTPELQKEALQ